MKQINDLLIIFGISEKSATIENFHEIKISSYSKSIIQPSLHDLEQVLNSFPVRDRVTIDVCIDELDPVTYNPSKQTRDFIEELNDIVSIKDENSNIKFIFSVRKVINNNILSVYDLSLFTEYLESQSLSGLFFSFNEIVTVHNHVHFELLNDTSTFHTHTFQFAPSGSGIRNQVLPNERNTITEKHTEICNFLNASEYCLIPDDFYLKGQAPDKIMAVFNKLCTVLAIIFISDISKIVGENELYFRINGYKMIQNNLHYNSLSKPNVSELYAIYNWIYNEGNLSDKVGLSRNILTLNYQEDKVIKDTTYASIRSGYEIYLKKNIEQYIEVKNKVSEFLMNMSYKSSEIVSSFSNSIKSNNTVFLTFFMSVIVFNALSTGKINLIFTGEIQALSYAILCISFLFLIASLIYIYEATNRFKKQYMNLKSMYADIIEENDLRNIFNNDQVHKDDLKYIFHKTLLYAVYWFFEIVILFIAILVASNMNQATL
ncbi:hypothetical protein [Paenibacillus vini]|uniref:Uncharacterized protein n=1 Tax=Paenibacillus vini TaxID=1476024 RepID=A0ABQ4MAB0_9BACL|nr:hypothetical protein [Paenibacillus vini]GIP52912.1 hypothetical protein J42TS3_19470 [Paenibacillus vini]